MRGRRLGMSRLGMSRLGMSRLGVVAVLAALAAPGGAETLLVERIRNAPLNGPDGLPRPLPGTTMDRVLERFGEPERRRAAVGDPPIARWVYDRFTVYFEGRMTIVSVVHSSAMDRGL